MTAAEFARLTQSRRRGGSKWYDGRCPGHPDERPSMSFCDGNNGLIVICRAGCTREKIAAALGLTLADFDHPRADNGHRVITATYDYVDERGTLLSQNVRYEPKDFRQRRPDGNGGYIWNLEGVRRVPYRLPELAEQLRVFICEGEKDCDKLWDLDLAATTNAGGAGRWTDEHTVALLAAAVPEVIVIPDNDAPGEKHAIAIAESCARAGIRVKIVRLSGLPPKGDVSDWLQAGHTREELLQLADAAPLFCGSAAASSDASAGIQHASIAEILQAKPEDLETTYVVKPWLPQGGLAILSGIAGSGKGKLAQDLAIARASGGTWLGLPVTPGPVLFWSGEQGKREDFRVTQALSRGRGLTQDSFPHYFDVIYDPTLRFGAPRMRAEITERLNAHPGLLAIVDSLRRSFDGDESDSAIADSFYQDTIAPLRRAGATIVILAHPPKTTGQQKAIADENMIRGSGDWLGQVDTFLVLRPINRTRHDLRSETINMRLSHVKARSGPQADPLLVTLNITEDDTSRVTFRLSAKTILDGTSTADELAGAVSEITKYMEQARRAGRAAIVDALKNKGFGRPTVESAIKQAVALGILFGPLTKATMRKGERGHVYVFSSPNNGADSTRDDNDLSF